jgi:hypothetical protein
MIGVFLVLLLLYIQSQCALEIRPIKGEGKKEALTLKAAAPLQNIVNHNGPVLSGNVTFYTIYYGTQFTAAGPALLQAFYKNVGASAWFSIVNMYISGKGASVAYGNAVTNKYVQGKALTDSIIPTIVTNAIAAGGMGTGATNDVYVIIFDPLVSYQGFCSAWCAFHWYYNKPNNGGSVKYIVIGDPMKCSSSCSVLNLLGIDSPNNNFEFDSIINILAHEIAEVITDPLGTAWYFTSTEDEVADQCQWVFGSYKQTNGRYYSEIMGSYKFMIQTLWNKNTQVCSN